MDAEDRPLGYWLKQVDRLLDDAFDRVLRDEGVTRRHWHVLNVLRRGART